MSSCSPPRRPPTAPRSAPTAGGPDREPAAGRHDPQRSRRRGRRALGDVHVQLRQAGLTASMRRRRGRFRPLQLAAGVNELWIGRPPLQVRATDPTGKQGPPASRTWIVEIPQQPTRARPRRSPPCASPGRLASLGGGMRRRPRAADHDQEPEGRPEGQDRAGADRRAQGEDAPRRRRDHAQPQGPSTRAAVARA